MINTSGFVKMEWVVVFRSIPTCFSPPPFLWELPLSALWENLSHYNPLIFPNHALSTAYAYIVNTTTNWSTMISKFLCWQKILLQVYHLYSSALNKCFFQEKTWQVAYSGPYCIKISCLNKIQNCLNKVHKAVMLFTNNKIYPK